MRGHDATLVVLESGGTWPAWLSPAGACRVAAIAQSSEVPLSALFAQVASRITKLEQEGYAATSAVLVWSPHTVGRRTTARDALARGLVARLARSGRGELVVALPSEPGQRTVHRVRALVAALAHESQGSVRVSLRVGGGAPEYAPCTVGLRRADVVAVAS